MAKMMKNNYLNLLLILLLAFLNACEGCGKEPSLRGQAYEQKAKLPPKKEPLEGIFVNAANKTLDAAEQDGKTWASAYDSIKKALDSANKDIHTNIIIAKGVYTPEEMTIEHKSISFIGSYTSGDKEVKNVTIASLGDDDNNWTVIDTDPGSVDPVVFSVKNKSQKVSISGIRFKGDFTNKAIDISDSSKKVNIVLRTLSFINDKDDVKTKNGINITAAKEVSLRDISCLNVISDDNGGCININDTYKVNMHSIHTDSTSSGKDGGAINIANIDEFDIKSSSFKNAKAKQNGGALNIQTVKSSDLRYCTFDKNEAIINGGAIFLNDGAISIKGATFNANKAPNGDGGAFYTNQISNFSINNSVIKESQSQNGAGIFIQNADNVSLTKVDMTDNEATLFSGSFYLDSIANKINIKDSLIEHNKQGAIINNSDAKIFISKTNFNYNESTEVGGAIYFDENKSIITITDCKFEKNKAPAGGALYIDSSDNSIDTMRTIIKGKTLFKENNAYKEKSGGAIRYLSNGLQYKGKPTLLLHIVGGFMSNTSGVPDPSKPDVGNIGNSISVSLNSADIKDIVDLTKTGLTATESKEIFSE